MLLTEAAEEGSEYSLYPAEYGGKVFQLNIIAKKGCDRSHPFLLFLFFCSIPAGAATGAFLSALLRIGTSDAGLPAFLRPKQIPGNPGDNNE